jgi:hypothetical protein
MQEPKYVFLTAFKTSQFEKHLREMGLKHVFEKPLSLDQLASIFDE